MSQISVADRSHIRILHGNVLRICTGAVVGTGEGNGELAGVIACRSLVEDVNQAYLAFEVGAVSVEEYAEINSVAAGNLRVGGRRSAGNELTLVVDDGDIVSGAGVELAGAGDHVSTEVDGGVARADDIKGNGQIGCACGKIKSILEIRSGIGDSAVGLGEVDHLHGAGVEGRQNSCFGLTGSNLQNSGVKGHNALCVDNGCACLQCVGYGDLLAGTGSVGNSARRTYVGCVGNGFGFRCTCDTDAHGNHTEDKHQ